ncbi:MAG TPA: hypothetical protein VNV25_17240 [Gemmatimonadaceae bacterium]|jgi:hypothetical protein|nr:hypothetical protein [Gemmatimonadaceae bacterium]
MTALTDTQRTQIVDRLERLGHAINLDYGPKSDGMAELLAIESAAADLLHHVRWLIAKRQEGH